MHGAGDHGVRAAVAERLRRPEQGEELHVGVEAFGSVEAQLLGRQRGEACVAHEVDRRDAHLHYDWAP